MAARAPASSARNKPDLPSSRARRTTRYAAPMDFLRRLGVPIGLIVIALMLTSVSPLGVLVLLVLAVWLLIRLREKPPALCDTCRFNHPDHCRRPERGSATFCAGYDKGPPPRPPAGTVIPFRPPPGEA